MPFTAQTIGAATSGVFVGALFSDTFSVGDNEVDMVRLTLTAGLRYEFDVDNGASGDFYLRIFDSRGNEVRANDDGNFAADNIVFGPSPYAEFVAAYTGDYYIAISPYYLSSYDPTTTAGRVSGENPLANTAGTLTVNQLSTARWSSAASINGLIAESGNDMTDMVSTIGGRTRLEVDASIDSTTDVDIARFDLAKGSRIVFDVNGAQSGSILGTVLRAFDSAGTQLGFDDDSGFGEDPEMIFNTPSSGSFYFGISGEGNSTYNGFDGTGTVSGPTGVHQVIVHLNPTHVGSSLANSLTGSASDEYIVSLAGNDTINAGGGRDMLAGGDDQDSLSGDDGDDDLYGEHGNDTLLGGQGADILIGGLGDDSMEGGAENDRLSGGDGVDILVGGTGVNTLEGGVGDDYYYVSNATDTLIEETSAGNDNVFTYVNLTLGANLENIFSLGTAGTLTGNTLGNSMIGGFATVAQTMSGLEGNDTLDGSAARDTLLGGEGDDVILGRAGNDSMEGGNGNDSYYVEQALDEVVEAAGGTSGTQDIVYAGVNFTLTANVEYGFSYGATTALTGNASANALLAVYSEAGVTLNGLAGNDTFYGSNFNDTLNGGDNDDLFFGLLGNDSSIGGAGNDTYFLQQAGDVAVEAAGQGTDVVYAAFDYTLSDHFETLFIHGGAQSATGNAADNTLVGSYLAGVNLTLNGAGGNDRIISTTGNDQIFGGTGNDTLTGDAGDDTFFYNAAGLGIDTITDFSAGAGLGDRINVSSVFASFAAVTAAATQAGGNTTITASAGNQIILAGVTIAQLNADDFVF
jgi:Ca2+-binding RTX toxin-like protein